MKFTYGDVERIVDDISFDGKFNEWLFGIWEYFIEPSKRFVCGNALEIIGFYRLISGLCKLYGGFCNMLNSCGDDECDVYLDIDYGPLLEYAEVDEENEDGVKDYIRALIDQNSFSEVRTLLEKAGTDKLFASLYFAAEYEDFSFSSGFDDAFDSIMNEPNADKMAAYEWLKGIFG